MFTYRISVWTGPTLSDAVAEDIKRQGFPSVIAGTERVYFDIKAPTMYDALASAHRALLWTLSALRISDVGCQLRNLHTHRTGPDDRCPVCQLL